MSRLYRESLLGLCGYDGSPERLSELFLRVKHMADGQRPNCWLQRLVSQ